MPHRQLDRSQVKTRPLSDRVNRVDIRRDCVSPDAQPRAATERETALLDELAGRIRRAVAAGKPVVLAFGAHVIKNGLAPVLIDLMDRGYVTGLVMNGSTAIHDFEIAIAGHTSEDVEAVLPDGSFGSAEQTGREMNIAYAEAARDSIGGGEALGRKLDEIADDEFRGQSVLLAAWERSIPVTVHVAVGTDTPHTHPRAIGSAIGAATHHDFRLFCSLVRELNEGGAYLNLGSAVVLPEVFLKALSIARNQGHAMDELTAVSMDMNEPYRAMVNVVKRPTAQSGTGFALRGRHEMLFPLFWAALRRATDGRIDGG